MDRPGDVAELLRFLVHRIDEQIESGEASITPPALLRLDGADVATAVDGIDIRSTPLEGHPVDVLTGFTAPPEWFGVGVLTGGWLRHFDAPRDGTRMRMVALVCRDGTELAGIRVAGGELELMESRAVGVMADTLRRVLELPTDPPEVTIDEWMAVCWLQLIVQQTRRGTRATKLRWRDAARLHPAVRTMGAPVERLAVEGPRTAAQMSWEGLRRAHAREGDTTAAWMDEGMFARWQVGGRPPLSRLLQQARRRLTPEARAAVEATLAGWGLLDGASVA